MRLHFEIPGRPAAQGSKRHIGGGRMIEQSKYLKPWRDALITHMRAKYTGQPLDEPIAVTAVFFIPKPKHPKYPVPATPPDTDKLCRALGDALTMAGVIKDDARITTWHATKAYHPQGWTGAHIHLDTLERNPNSTKENTE